MPDPINRRDFLKSSAIAASVATVGMVKATSAAEEPTKPVAASLNALPTRELGKTGYRLPILACGGSALMGGLADYYGVEKRDTAYRVAMIRGAYDKGIRYFDTAPAYEECEGIYGEALEGVRDDIYLATKVFASTEDEARASVENSLNKLRTDHVECLQLHNAGENAKYDGAMRLYEIVAKFRDEGLCKFIGLTGHAAHGEMFKLIETGNFDTLLIDFGYFGRGYMTRHSKETLASRDACVAKAAELNVGLIAMKVMGANVFSHGSEKLASDKDKEKLERLPGAAIRWVLNDGRFDILNIGASMPSDLDENIATVSLNMPFTPADEEMLRSHKAAVETVKAIQDIPVV